MIGNEAGVNSYSLAVNETAALLQSIFFSSCQKVELNYLILSKAFIILSKSLLI